MTTALFAMSHEHLRVLFPLRQMTRLTRLVDVDTRTAATDFTAPNVTEALASTEILITGPGCPRIDSSVLDGAPWLRAILHAGSSVRGLITKACWDRAIRVSSAEDAVSIPSAEFTLGVILLSGKNAFTQGARYRLEKAVPADRNACHGNFGRRVGVIGATRVGRRVIELLRPFDFEIAVYDPFLDPDEAAWLRVDRLPLNQLLATSDVVTLHQPLSPRTLNLLDADRLARLPDGATLINTSDAALIDPEALAREVSSGRINAVLDSTDPFLHDGGLHHLPNVFITPRLAESLGGELERIGSSVVDELDRLLAGRPMLHRVLQAG